MINLPLPDAQRVLYQCDQLARFSAMPDGVLRAYLTPEHAQANRQVSEWMNAASMTSWQDAAGNICGRYTSAKADAPVLILGSHLDTVPNAGKYDGILGVLGAIEVVRCLAQAKVQLPFHLDIIGFADEEGTRFGATLLGSKAVAGRWQNKLFDCVDKDGISLYQAMQDFGLDPANIASASRAAENLLGFWELHIEQGPVLEQQQCEVGVVISIAGARRFQIEITGMAGHAGTVPMAMRADALVKAAKLILDIERIACEYKIVATVGKIEALPGAVNVIPGAVKLSLDIRAEKDSQRDKALHELQRSAGELLGEDSIRWQETHSSPAVICDTTFQQGFAAVIAQQGIEVVHLFSGAGHDAMEMAQICPMAMLFMRCGGGISHNPAESVTREDTAVALTVLQNALLAEAARQS